MNVLEKILKAKTEEIARQQEACSTRKLEQSPHFSVTARSLSRALLAAEPVGIIAEIKRKSPSKGIFKEHIDIESLSAAYIESGAAALSILTDQHFFGGSSQDLSAARCCCGCPILRKDFVLSEYQIIEAKAIGADAVLLLANVLSPKQLRSFAQLARSLTMEVLLEVHCLDELERGLSEVINLVGVNNRDLKTFEVDPKRSYELAARIPSEFVKVSESGLKDAKTILELNAVGFRGFLIGETFMASSDPALACSQLVAALKKDHKGVPAR